MSSQGYVVRCVSQRCASRGYQARVPLPSNPKRFVSAYFAAKTWDGMRAARAAAKQALPVLRRRARAQEAAR